jgi:hypothetical protein
MNAIAISRGHPGSSCVPVSGSGAFLTLWMLMSNEDLLKKLWVRDDLSPKAKFEAYLDGYLMAFDPYPICKRQLFCKNDLHALLLDFFAVGNDMNKATQAFIASESSAQDIADDEARRRAIEAAVRTLAAIERTKAKITQGDG